MTVKAKQEHAAPSKTRDWLINPPYFPPRNELIDTAALAIARIFEMGWTDDGGPVREFDALVVKSILIDEGFDVASIGWAFKYLLELKCLMRKDTTLLSTNALWIFWRTEPPQSVCRLTAELRNEKTPVNGKLSAPIHPPESPLAKFDREGIVRDHTLLAWYDAMGKPSKGSKFERLRDVWNDLAVKTRRKISPDLPGKFDPGGKGLVTLEQAIKKARRERRLGFKLDCVTDPPRSLLNPR